MENLCNQVINNILSELNKPELKNKLNIYTKINNYFLTIITLNSIVILLLIILIIISLKNKYN